MFSHIALWRLLRRTHEVSSGVNRAVALTGHDSNSLKADSPAKIYS
jgi:hypothetical protein